MTRSKVEHRRPTSAPLLFAAVVLACGGGCHRADEDADILPPAGWTPEPPRPAMASPAGKARFGPGWYPVESNADGSWRWMAQSGEIRISGVASTARLELYGWAPLEFMNTPPVFRVSINGRELDRFVPPSGRFRKSYDVPEELQRGVVESVLRLETSATAIAPGDPRPLGFALVSVTWRSRSEP